MLDSSIPGPHGKFQQGIFDIRRPKPIQRPLKDVAKSLAGIAIFHRCLARFCPLPSDWFKFRLKGRWEIDVGLGCLMFPLVNWLSQSIVARDPFTVALHAVVISVCASFWEEIVFRGFNLPSLTKYLPVWCSILVSSVVFALAHFNAQSCYSYIPPPHSLKGAVAMETSPPLSIESFSYSWLTNIKPSFESLDESLRASLDASHEAAFIEMDPRMTPSKRFLGDAHDFNFDCPISESLTLVHADELFSNGLLMPLFDDPSNAKACNTTDYIPTTLPISLESSATVLLSDQIHYPFLKRCRRSSKRIFQKYLSFLRPLYRKVRGSRLGSRAETIDTQLVKSWGNSQQSSPGTRTRYSTGDWYDFESSIYEAVLHCKKSIALVRPTQCAVLAAGLPI
ncbi:hypothetical protein HHK36_000134 [Tetracentron sinense]|uniref:CAAX prenyl protease 2/Lysostaphin resistance protein A-like domain-containing protein n=1 Tax=Tetracentron sinense TaxID=13715 RepID=A0A834ZRE4_TETSI|nr:hypothetical protein HHK36_000134 [Tetracentron sinense]